MEKYIVVKADRIQDLEREVDSLITDNKWDIPLTIHGNLIVTPKDNNSFTYHQVLVKR